MANKKSRADGEGTMYRRSDGKWVVSVSAGFTPTGKRKRITRVREKKSDALAALRGLQATVEQPSESPTVKEYLTLWLRDVVSKLAHNTRVSYRRSVDNHLNPLLGKHKLATLNALQIETAMNTIEKPAMRRYAFRVLRTALNRAVRLRVLDANPCAFADAPKHKPKDADPFTQAEVKQILDDVEGTNHAVIYEMAFGLGMRYAEIMGLHWDDVDFTGGKVFVHQQLITANGVKPHFATTKTQSSIRTLQPGTRLMDALHDRRATMLRQGLAKDGRVVCGARGGVMWPQTFWVKQWQPLLKRLGIRHRGFHQTRHTYATLQLRAGVPVHIVSSILGHSNAAMTLKVYAHLMEGDGSSAADSIDRLLG